jgi:hypothetical protein
VTITETPDRQEFLQYLDRWGISEDAWNAYAEVGEAAVRGWLYAAAVEIVTDEGTSA